VLECGVDIGAVATGDGIARWDGATFYWYAGKSRDEPIDSLRISGAEVRRSFARDSISAAREETSAWDLSGRAPFDAELRFRFVVKGESVARSAAVRFTCGPSLPQGGAIAPALIVESVSPGGDMEPGDTVRVSYSASSTFGLWVTGVAVADAFLFNLGFAEGLEPAATNTVELEIPWDATLGAFLDMNVYALDGMLQVTSQMVGGDIRIVDVTKPRVASATGVAAQYAVGQAMDFEVRATDNGRVAWIIYELGAPVNLRDSVPTVAPVPAASRNIHLTVQPHWVGTPTLSLFARDAAGLLSDALVVPAGGITFVPAPPPAP
jgi:hypothetical protein